jgi:hypothetical protein
MKIPAYLHPHRYIININTCPKPDSGIGHVGKRTQTVLHSVIWYKIIPLFRTRCASRPIIVNVERRRNRSRYDAIEPIDLTKITNFYYRIEPPRLPIRTSPLIGTQSSMKRSMPAFKKLSNLSQQRRGLRSNMET